MFSRENLVGILLLIFCAVVACIMIFSIVTGTRPTVPEPMKIPILVVGGGAMIILLWQRFSRRFRR